MLTYNKLIYGDAKYTPAETVAKLRAENCVDGCGRITRFPDWFKGAEIFDAINAGLLTTKTYKNCYSHTDYFLVEG